MNAPPECEPGAGDASDGECLVYRPGEYNKIQKSFIQNFLKEPPEGGMKRTGVQARDAWKSSLKRAKLLSGVSLTELKKRKFVPKGTTTNPFKIRVEESMKS